MSNHRKTDCILLSGVLPVYHTWQNGIHSIPYFLFLTTARYWSFIDKVSNLIKWQNVEKEQTF